MLTLGVKGCKVDITICGRLSGLPFYHAFFSLFYFVIHDLYGLS